MRTWIRTALYELALLAGSGLVDWMTDFPGWIWGIVFVVSLGLALWMHWQDAKRSIKRIYHVRHHERIVIKDTREGKLNPPEGD